MQFTQVEHFCHTHEITLNTTNIFFWSCLISLVRKKNTHNYIKDRISKQLTSYEILFKFYFIEEIKRLSSYE